MKNLIVVLISLFAMVSLVQAQDNKPPMSPKITVESPDKNIKVVYGQPSKKGRVVFGADGSSSVEKYGKVWRTDANDATEVTFKSDVMFGGKMVKAGNLHAVYHSRRKRMECAVEQYTRSVGRVRLRKNQGRRRSNGESAGFDERNTHRKTNHYARKQQHYDCLGQHDGIGTSHEAWLRKSVV